MSEQVVKTGTYNRVSKDDGSQTVENQLIKLRAMALSIGAEIVDEYVDHASGAKSDREDFLRMFDDAEQGKFSLLLIWSLDRFSREGIHNTLGYIERLKRAGVSIKSIQEPWLDTRDEGIGELLISIFSWVAKQERLRILARSKAGQDRARAEGKLIGRPKGAKDKRTRENSGYLKAWNKRKEGKK